MEILIETLTKVLYFQAKNCDTPLFLLQCGIGFAFTADFFKKKDTNYQPIHKAHFFTNPAIRIGFILARDILVSRHVQAGRQGGLHPPRFWPHP